MSLPAHHTRQIGSGFRRPGRTGGVIAPHGGRPARSILHAEAPGGAPSGPVAGPPAWLVAVGLGGAPFTVGAVILEAISGQYANSPTPDWAHWVPLAWPQPLRVVWWLVVAVTASAFRWSLHHVGLRPNPVVTVCIVAPFLVFAAGVGVGADWATWH